MFQERAWRDVGALVVDDQPDIRYLVRMVVEAANEGLHMVGEAASGAEALQFLEDTDADVVILDEMMPGMTGIETATEIRRRYPDQRVILFSAYVDSDLRNAAAGQGIEVCLHKDEVARLPDVLADSPA
jgi:CheY-like chemotaxis protein